MLTRHVKHAVSRQTKRPADSYRGSNEINLSLTPVTDSPSLLCFVPHSCYEFHFVPQYVSFQFQVYLLLGHSYPTFDVQVTSSCYTCHQLY